MSQNMEKHEFQSEAKQVLELMIHSVYSNPDIFVRELISNASDAIDKLRIEGLSNPKAADLAKEGRIDITVDKATETLTISDNGIGMSKIAQKRVFEMFYREHTGDLHDVKGHGLGLAYVKKIIDDHNGQIFVESEKGKGSTFIIKIPLIN